MNARRLKIISVVIALLVVLYAVFGFLLAPWLVERYLPSQLQKKLGREVSLSEVAINPFLLTLQAKGFSVAGQQDKPVLSFDRLFADLSVRGILQKTWTLDRVDLDGLKTHVIRQKDGSINLVQLAERLKSPDSQSSDQGPPAVAIGELSVSGASLTYTDLTGSKPAEATLSPVSFHAADFATQSEQAAHFDWDATLPESGKLSGKGQLALQPAMSVSGNLDLAGLKAGVVWPFVRDAVNLAKLQAVADMSGQYSYSNDKVLQLSNLALTLSDVLLVRPGETQPLLAMKQIQANGGSVDVAQHSVTLSKLGFKEGEVTVALTPDGSVNWAQLAASKPANQPLAPNSQPATQAQPAVGSASPRWKAEATQLTLDSVNLHFLDQGPARAKPLAVDVGNIGASLKLSLDLGGNTQVVVKGADLRAGAIDVGQPGSDEPAIRLAGAHVEAADLDLQGQRFSAQALRVDGGKTRVIRGASGNVSLLDTLGIAQGASGAAATSSAGPGKGSSEGSAAGAADTSKESPSGWRYELAEASLKNFDVALADQGFKPAIAYDLNVQSLSVKNISSAGQQPSPFDVAVKVEQGGTLKASGDASLDAKRVKARLNAENFTLVPLQPLLQRFAALKLQSGTLSTSADICYGCDKDASLQASGKLQLSDLLVNEAWSGDRFMSWKQMDADGISFDLASRQLSIKDVTLDRPGAKIAIAEDRSVNVSQMFKKADDPPKKSVRSQAKTAPESSQPAFNFRIDRVSLRSGEVDYADLSLVLPFSTKVTALNGTVVGISSDTSRRADVKADGSIEPYGSASVAGSIIPFSPETFTDLRVKFNNVLVPPLSPYTATFAGRKVESGKLWLDLDYKVQDSQLLGKNDIRLSDFTLGERVDAPNAMNLPLDLAVALLTDSKGQIDLSVPVRGDLDNPQFSIGSAVKQVIGNLIQRIVTAPFRAIASLFGGGDGNSDAMANVDFSAGSADLRPEQREKLDSLTKALNERPKLQLVISAPYDPKADANALQRLQARRALAQTMGRTGGANNNQAAEPVAYDDPATRRALEALLASQAGQDAAQQLLAQAQGQKTSERQVYETMFDKIASSIAVDPSTLQLIATQRAQAISSYLRQKGVSPERLKTGRIAAVSNKSDDNASDVSAHLDIAAGGPAG